MVNEEHKAAVHRLLEAFNAQDAAVFDELGTPEIAQQCKDTMREVYAMYDGHHIDSTDMLAEGEKAWARVATRGGHSGEWEGIPRAWTSEATSNNSPACFVVPHHIEML